MVDHLPQGGQARRQSRWRELPNIISSRDGTEERLPHAALARAARLLSDGSADEAALACTAVGAAAVSAGAGPGG
jgi:hypothetical protein